MLGAVQRTVRGIEVTEETLSYDVIEQAVLGVGHYLGSAQTLALMESEFVYPEVADRTPPGAWEQNGAYHALARARVRAREILSAHYPVYIDAGVDARIRQRLPIRLPRDAMRADCGRW
jgi:trimethylamine--corrinoid protein Co-methyltransferase